MEELEESIGEMAAALMAMPREELRHLEKNLRQLTLEQVQFVLSTLESAQHEDHVPALRLTLLEQFFESWWKHSMATKLVVIDRIIELSNGGVWPGGIPLLHTKADICDDACAVVTD